MRALPHDADLPKFEVLEGTFRDTAQVPRGRELHYRCLKCGGSISSQPKESGGCACGNVFIDLEYHRLVVGDFGCFQVLRKIGTRSKRGA